MKNIVIFASGSGTNAENIIRHFSGDPDIQVVAVFCNKPGAGVIERAENLNVPVIVFNKHEMLSGIVESKLDQFAPSLIVLAGYLWLIPLWMIHKYPNRIVNIHPALLPSYGGKGMYGSHVHKAVLENKEPSHGVSVHFVNEKFDEGEVILQESFKIEPGDNLESVEAKIHKIEFRIYPQAIKKVLN